MRAPDSARTGSARHARALVLAALLAGCVVPAAVRAAGYSLFEQGSAALGRAGAFTATANDPSAIFFNPAGVARLQGTQFMGGVSTILPRVDFAGAAPYPGYDVSERWNDKIHVPPHGYATFPLARGIVAGVGVYLPFGLDSDWRDPDTFSGRFIATLAQVRGYYVTPTLAVELTPKLSVGAGVSLVFADAALKRRIPASVFENGGQRTEDIAELALTCDTSTSATFDVGLLYDAGRVHVGASYRHGVSNELKGDAALRFLPTGEADRDSVLAARLPSNQRGAVDVPFPASASFGVAYDVGDGTRLEVDLNWMGWSALDELPITFDDPALDVTIPERYDDVFSIRAGVSARASDKLVLRGGYYFDDVPSPSASVGPILPDARRHGLTGGFGYTNERWRLDLFEMLLLFEDRPVRDNRDDFNGNYAQSAWVSGVSLTYAIW